MPWNKKTIENLVKLEDKASPLSDEKYPCILKIMDVM